MQIHSSGHWTQGFRRSFQGVQSGLSTALSPQPGFAVEAEPSTTSSGAWTKVHGLDLDKVFRV